MISLRSNWLNNHRTDVFTLSSLTVNQGAYCVETSFLFSFVFMFKVSKRVLKIWQGCAGPVVRWVVALILLKISTAESSKGEAVEVLFEAKHAEILIISLVGNCIPHECDTESLFIRCKILSISQLHLVSPCWSDWHDDLSQHICEVIWRQTCAVDLTLEETIVLVSCALVNQRVVVVT